MPISWKKGVIEFLPIPALVALVLWTQADVIWARIPTFGTLAGESSGPLRIIAVSLGLCAFRCRIPFVRVIHTLAAVLACIPLSLFSMLAFFFLIVLGGIILLFATVLSTLEMGVPSLSAADFRSAFEAISLLATLVTAATVCWYLTYRLVLEPYSPRTDHRNERIQYTTTLILLLNAGIFGAHHFRLKNYIRGPLYLGTFGFAGLGVLYDLIQLTRGKLRNGDGHAVTLPPPPKRITPPPLTGRNTNPAQLAGPPPTQPKHRSSTWIPFLLVTGFFCLIGTVTFFDFGWPVWGALPAGILAGLVCVSVLLTLSLSITREKRRILRTLPSQLKALAILFIRRFESHDISSARKASRTNGSVKKCDSFNLWAENEKITPDRCEHIVNHTRTVLAKHFGPTIAPNRPLRVIAFTEVDSMAAYARPLNAKLSAEFAGYYTWYFCPRIVVSDHLADAFPFYFDRTFAHEYSHYLHFENNRAPQPLWLSEGFASWMSSEAYPTPSILAPGANRLRRYLRDSGALVDGTELINANSTTTISPKNADSDADSRSRQYLQATTIYLQSECLVRWLAAQHREALESALFGPAAPPATPGAFTRHFGVGPDQAMEAASAAHEFTSETETPETPDDAALREHLLSDILYPALNSSTNSEDTKIRALRMLTVLEKDSNPVELRALHDASKGNLRAAAQCTLEILGYGTRRTNPPETPSSSVTRTPPDGCR